MCLRIRQEQAEPRGSGATPPLPPPGARRPRSRWAIAGATALVAGLAAAAIVAPSPPAKVVQAAPVPVRATPATLVPATGAAIEQTAATMDDDVPSAPAPTRSRIGPCEHGM